MIPFHSEPSSVGSGPRLRSRSRNVSQAVVAASVHAQFRRTAKNKFEALAEAFGHETVDDRVDAAVEVGHQVKSRVHVFQKTASHVWNDVVGR